MSNGPCQVFYTGAASGASLSSYLDFGGKSYTKFAVNYATMSTGAVVTVYGAASASGTYKQVNVRVNTSTAQYAALQIPSSVSGSGWAVFDSVPFQYVKFGTDAVVSGGVSYTVLAYD